MALCLNCGNFFEPSKRDPRIKFCSQECRIQYRLTTKYMQKYYSENKSKWVERQADTEVKKRKNDSRREKYKNDPEYRERAKQQARESNRRNPATKIAQHLAEFGITIDEYDRMLEKQEYKCAICGGIGDVRNRYRMLSVDHDHKTGKVRGLLCFKCNFLLGNARDDVSILQKAIDYLEENSI